MKLVDVPNHEFMESPSSWLTRLALRQVVSPRELESYLDLSIRVDCEMALARTSFEELANRIAEISGSFRMVDTVMQRLRKIDLNGDRYLLRRRSVAYHRYCAACLATDRIKYFRLEWRFKCWRWCPIHVCLLQERCPHCNKEVMLPGDMYRAGPDGLGIATLDRCLHCAELLTTGWQTFVGSLEEDDLTTPREQALTSNGRSVLAALLCGRLRMKGVPKIYSFKQLKNIELLGYLPHVNFQLSHDELLRRKKGESHAHVVTGEQKKNLSALNKINLPDIGSNTQ